MPIGKLQRKPSNETLQSFVIDGGGGTIDSRMSSTDIPKMEILKVNYVQQCKEALMQQKPIEPPAFLAHLQSHQQHLRQNASPLQQPLHYKQMAFKRSTIAGESTTDNVTKITVNTRTVPPPPTIESWQLLQGHKNEMSKAKPKPNEIVCCNSSCTSDDSDQGTDSTMSPDCEKSNSWNYRAKCSTRDIRRDIARAGTKSRADRIALIEHTECDHHRTAMKTPGSRASMPTTPTEKISKIQQLFEHATAAQHNYQHHHQQQQKLEQIRKTPPQPSRPAPIPRKEPNARHRTPNYSPMMLRRCLDTDTTDCCGAASSSSSPSVESRRMRDSRFVSRIPKPINEHNNNRSSTTSAMLFSEANEHLQRRIQQMFEPKLQATSAAAAAATPPTKSIPCDNDSRCHYAELKFSSKASPPPRRKLVNELPAAAATDALPLNDLLRQSRPTSSNYLKMKLERVHIRKKRQPLLIINQLKSDDEPTASTPTNGKAAPLRRERSFDVLNDKSRSSTCGYKNCNFSNCPMSAQHKDKMDCHSQHQQQQKHQKEMDKFKRLSLESGSDSGVSTSHDKKEENRENKRKNLEKCVDCENCVDCVKMRQTNEATSKNLKGKTVETLSTEKSKKLSDETSSDKHIKIQVNKPPASDPNDVQNFAKKNLTKTTTDEMLNSVSNTNKMTKSKECNIENERINNLRQRTTIKIDDDWVQEPFETISSAAAATMLHDHDFCETDSLMPKTPALSTQRKPINANDNCVKIFVRSSTTNGGANTRASSVSANSYASRTSGCSSISSNSSKASSLSSSSAHTDADQHDCCAQLILSPPVNSGGVYFNSTNSCIHLNSATASQRACPPSPLSSLELVATTPPQTSISRFKNRKRIDSSSSGVNSNKNPLTCCGDVVVDGVFWNNSYHHDEDAQCCCSLSSCDDDNCSYYDGGGVGDVVVVETTSSYHNEKPRPPALKLRLDSSVERGEHERDRRFNALHPHQRRQLQQELRMSSAEEILIRNKKLLRKTDVIHELRPRSMDGVADSGVSLSGDTGSSPDSSEHMQNQQQDSESRRLKRGHVLSELLETERIYVNEMSSILKGYCDQMQSEEMMHLVPASLHGKEELLFGNLHELYTFHNEIFLKDLENCISTTELVALCFVQRRDTFYRLYSFYCQNIPRSERLRETLVDTHLFLQECQKRLGHKLPLGAYLLKPVQRITKYQLLLKDLLRFSDSGNCTKELQKALDCMLIVLKCVNDSMHQVAITGFPTDLSQQGELLLQDSFQVWTESKKDIRLRIKPQQRHIFLYQKSMLFCKQTSKPGHNKSTYQFKHHLKMSQIGLTESVRGDTKRFEVWLQGRQEVHTLQAPTLEIKNKWVAEIKRVLLNQLEELKGEKIKQYSLNHRGLKQTTSCDTPNILLGATGTQRTISCDASSESSNRNSNCSASSGDDNCSGSSINITAATMMLPPNINTNTTANNSIASSNTLTNNSIEIKDQLQMQTQPPQQQQQHEVYGWSSDCSNSEDEMSIIEDNSTPGSKFLALADYIAMGHSEVSMREGDTVELLKVGCAGWWFVRILDTNAEGWTPAAYLESINRKSSRSSSRTSGANKFN